MKKKNTQEKLKSDVREYCGLSKQRFEILSIIKKLKKTTPNDVVVASKDGIGNPHDQISKLTQDGFVKRVGSRAFSLTSKGEAVFSPKTEVREKNIKFNKEEVEGFLEFAKKENCLDLLSEMLNPALLGLEKERLACLLSMISNWDDFNDRNRITVLYEGPTSTGKTAIIRWAQRFLWGGWVDSSVTRSSLEGSGKGYQFSQGCLQDADNSTLFIDEVDKLSHKDQSALLAAIELGSVPIRKDRVKKDTDARIRVVATCNNKQRLMEELLSRFDLIFHISPLSHEKIEKLIRKNINDWGREKQSPYGNGFLKKYLMFAKQREAKLPEDREWMEEFILTERKFGSLQGKDVRQVQAIFRIALAVAKLRLKECVDKQDLKRAIELIQ